VSATVETLIQLISVDVRGQSWGIPISAVREVLSAQSITPVPLAPPAVVGVLNLRGRIVTLLDLRVPLGLEPTAEPARAMQVVVEHEGELYSLIIDAVGESLSLDGGELEAPPKTMDCRWRDLTQGIVKNGDQLLLILSLDRLVQAVSVAA
jgi:purine-binding chemotaxis protein CheW